MISYSIKITSIFFWVRGFLADEKKIEILLHKLSFITKHRKANIKFQSKFQISYKNVAPQYHCSQTLLQGLQGFWQVRVGV